MKRASNLYKNIYDIDNIKKCFNEVCRNTKNKSKVNNYNDYRAIYINRIYNILKNKEYVVGPYNIFTIYEPKERRIVPLFKGLFEGVLRKNNSFFRKRKFKVES